MSGKKKELTESQKQDCNALKSIYESKKKELGLNQYAVADALGISQSAINHYLSGINALNPSIASGFARLLKVNVQDFSSSLAEEILEMARTVIVNNDVSSDIVTTSRYDIPNWIESVRNKMGLDVEEFEKKLNYSGRGSVHAWEAGRSIPSFDVLVRISELSGQPLPYIGRPRATANDDDLDSFSSQDEVPNGYIRLKLLDISAAAGSGKFNIDFPEYVRLIDVQENWARKHLGKNLQRISIITASGDSMYPTFADGDLLFVDKSIDFYDNEGVYVIATAGEVKVKRLQVMTNGDLKIISDNKSLYESEVLSKDSLNDIKICAKVTATWTLNSL